MKIKITFTLLGIALALNLNAQKILKNFEYEDNSIAKEMNIEFMQHYVSCYGGLAKKKESKSYLPKEMEAFMDKNELSDSNYLFLPKSPNWLFKNFYKKGILDTISESYSFPEISYFEATEEILPDIANSFIYYTVSCVGCFKGSVNANVKGGKAKHFTAAYESDRKKKALVTMTKGEFINPIVNLIASGDLYTHLALWLSYKSDPQLIDNLVYLTKINAISIIRDLDKDVRNKLEISGGIDKQFAGSEIKANANLQNAYSQVFKAREIKTFFQGTKKIPTSFIKDTPSLEDILDIVEDISPRFIYHPDFKTFSPGDKFKHYVELTDLPSEMLRQNFWTINQSSVSTGVFSSNLEITSFEPDLKRRSIKLLVEGTPAQSVFDNNNQSVKIEYTLEAADAISYKSKNYSLAFKKISETVSTSEKPTFKISDISSDFDNSGTSTRKTYEIEFDLDLGGSVKSNGITLQEIEVKDKDGKSFDIDRSGFNIKAGNKATISFSQSNAVGLNYKEERFTCNASLNFEMNDNSTISKSQNVDLTFPVEIVNDIEKTTVDISNFQYRKIDQGEEKSEFTFSLQVVKNENSINYLPETKFSQLYIDASGTKFMPINSSCQLIETGGVQTYECTFTTSANVDKNSPDVFANLVFSIFLKTVNGDIIVVDFEKIHKIKGLGE